MRPDRVVMAPPAFYDDLGLTQCVEYFAIEQFVAQACVKTLDVSVLPRAAWCDVGSLRTDRCNPCLHGLGDELRPIVGPYMARQARRSETCITSLICSMHARRRAGLSSFPSRSTTSSALPPPAHPCWRSRRFGGARRSRPAPSR